jgi:hypothetical protein
MSVATHYSLPSSTAASGVVVPLLDPTDKKLSTLMGEIIQHKANKIREALKDRTGAKLHKEVILIGGDVFNVGFLAFQGAQILKPSLATIPAVSLATFICGEIAGAINIGVSLVCLGEAIDAFKNGDKLLGGRLLLDFIELLAIGIIMILISLSTKVAALGAIGSFFAAFPWILPTIFFVAAIPIIYEISVRIFNMHTNRDLGSQLKNPNVNLKALIRGNDEKNPFHMEPVVHMLREGKEVEAKAKLKEKMERFQSDMGAIAALEAFKLLQQTLNNEKTEDQLKEVRKRISEWNNAQYVRLFEQVLFAAAFGVSMAALGTNTHSQTLEAAETFTLAAGNAVPAYMDIFWPFKRNIPITGLKD